MSLKSFIKHPFCPHCRSKHFKKRGFFYRRITHSYHQRHHCLDCNKSFSCRTDSSTYKQKRPDVNQAIFTSLTSGVTLRRTAKNLHLSYSTVYRKFLWLSERATEFHKNQKFVCHEIQFDETESLEHTKLKPLSVAIAVSGSYQILGVKVGSIPAKGLLAEISYKKYGPRVNESTVKVRELLLELKSRLLKEPEILKSDLKPGYKPLVTEIFPGLCYEQYLSRGNKEKRRELKYTKQEKKIFDPLFALNQRCAKLRDHVKRMTRRSWCTTKRKDHLEKHLMLYIASNNNYLFL